MPAVLFKCPITRQHVSAWVAEGVDARADGDVRPETIKCAACRQVHLVRPDTGKVFGVDDD